MSNLLGLLFLGRTLDGLEIGAEWTAFSRDAIEQEMRVQVLADGADYESSIPYHRLVAELFLGALRLTDHAGVPYSHAYRARVRDMIAYLAAVTRPDGLMPQVGDADDGRLHVFEGYATTTPQDPRHLFGPASAMFDEPSWAALGGSAGAWETAWWGLAPVSASAAPRGFVRLFPDAGVAVASNGAGHYLLVTNGVVGTNGFGNHKHNDLLSFELHQGGTAWIVDPGSYVYTSDGAARNRFRSTAMHNTVAVDDVEQNEFRDDWLFRMFEKAMPDTLSFADRGDLVEYGGRHRGYERLPEPIVHTRTFRWTRSTGDLEIVDRLEGAGRHRLRWHFHLAPGVTARLDAGGSVALTCGLDRRSLLLPEGLEVAVVPSDYSPSYGVKRPCLAIDAMATVAVDGSREWVFRVVS